MIASELSKQQAIDSDEKAMQRISSTGNLDQVECATIVFITVEVHKIIFNFLQGTVKVL